MKYKKLLFITAILAAFLLAAGCQSETPSTFPGEDETYAAEAAALGLSNRFAGVVCASGETSINKAEDREIAKILVSPGDEVTKGQVLFTYDGEQAQLNYDKAELELEQLRLTLQQSEDQKASLEKEKYQADASEQLSYTIQIQEADTNIRETAYNIKVKEDEVAKLKKALKKLKVKSPIDGKVQSINTEGAVDSNGNALPFMVLMNTGTYRVKAYINELNAMELYEGAKVIVRSRVDDSVWEGTVASVDFNNPVASQQGYDSEDLSEVSSSSKYPFYVTLDNADGLILGQHVYVEVEGIEFSSPVTDENGDEEMEGDENMADAEGMPEDVDIEEAMPDGVDAEEGTDPEMEGDMDAGIAGGMDIGFEDSMEEGGGLSANAGGMNEDSIQAGLEVSDIFDGED